MIEAYRDEVSKFLGVSALDAAREHARAVFPHESCGFITGDAYIACENAHPTPETHFIINDARFDDAMMNGTVKAIVHSHPYGPMYPSQLDMVQQIQTDVPWVIIMLNEDVVAHTIAWGDALPIAPVISRPFLHGVMDCYSMIRDVYRLGRDELLKQGIHWPLDPILLAEVPREDEWWKGDDDLYMSRFEQWGFQRITRSEARAGDAFLMAVGNTRTNPHKRINHGGVLLEHDQVLHHLPIRISARQPAGMWAKSADVWLRYQGAV